MDYASKLELYRQHAAECSRAAANAPEAHLREAYLDLCKAWLRLSEELKLEEQRQKASSQNS
jgi:DNA primase